MLAGREGGVSLKWLAGRKGKREREERNHDGTSIPEREL